MTIAEKTTEKQSQNARLAALREKNVPRGVSLGTGLYATHAKNATTWSIAFPDSVATRSPGR